MIVGLTAYSGFYPSYDYETLTSQIARIHDLPAHPCAEVVNSHASVVKVVMTCQFVTFTPPPGAEVLSARVVGSRVLLHVKIVIVNHPKALPGK